MAGKVRHLLNRDGRYFARLVVPKELRPFIDGKTELRTPLGPDRREALKRLPGAVALLQNDIALAERRAVEAGRREITVGRYPLAADQIALRNYQDRLAQDERLRNASPAWASVGIDDGFVARLREGIAGRLSDAHLAELVGHRIGRFRLVGNTTAEPGSEEWRALARAICISELEALERVAERDEGDFAGTITHPLLANAQPVVVDAPEPVTFTQVIDDEVKRRARGKDAKPLPSRTVKKYRDAATDFAKFRKSDDAGTVTAIEGKRWIEAMQDAGDISNRTVKAKFQNVRTILNWGRHNDPENFLPTGNPLGGIKTPDYATLPSYLRAFTMDEAKLVLIAARGEAKPMFRWIPWLCAYSGMRVSEAASLRKDDFFKVGERWFWRVTSAGNRSLKTASSERRIPVHKALVDEGFMAFVDAAPEGRLFRGETKDDINVQPRISTWVRDLIPLDKRPELSPNHGWRHLFEDLCRRDRVQEEARNYMTGRTDGHSQELYGRSEVMLPGLADAMDQITAIDLKHSIK